MSRLVKSRASLLLQQRLSTITQRSLVLNSSFSRHMTSSNKTLTNANRRLNTTAQWLQPKRQMSTSHESIAAAEQAQAEVLHRKNLSVREIILNRPSKLNALNLNMVRGIIPELKAWEKSDLAKIIVIKSEPGTAFCAGGDVKAVVDLAAEGKQTDAAKFFEEEYQMDHLIATLETPYISVMDGVTMGGGVGLSVHAPFRIATENTLFAMPETKIGFFPDVGGSFFLPRLDGQLGIYLGLTGKRLKAVDVLYAGVATHYIPSSRLPALEARLAELDAPTHDIINGVLDEFSGELDQEPSFSLGGDIRAAIDRCFKYDTMKEIVEAVQKEEEANPAWAKETLKYLNSMSPTSLKVTLQQLRSGATLSIAQCFKMEYHLLQKFVSGHDMKEGVYKTLVHRGQPSEWEPASLDQVDDKKIKSDYFNAPSPLTLQLLSTKDFKQYPHRKYMLPTEEDIKQVVTGEAADVGNYALTREEIVNYLVRERKGKQGVKQKVTEVLARKTKVLQNQDGQTLKWVY
ncbi:ClpP/crotonase-like domain-containing protein [Halteromyces radiatus]|uniref:ClpP/crotonase-like domain-containing protein n=1 Tax=Halteromyces radiatus TaxID=101107 RepID=UPI00222056DA|nr:ClpP/crotonase-like domain-containing protein [Halteromyces radiatus]KAI8096289.1 ClpP/crotonase-like domain-containing protein [Halteromyces radiatus]